MCLSSMGESSGDAKPLVLLEGDFELFDEDVRCSLGSDLNNLFSEPFLLPTSRGLSLAAFAFSGLASRSSLFLPGVVVFEVSSFSLSLDSSYLALKSVFDPAAAI